MTKAPDIYVADVQLSLHEDPPTAAGAVPNADAYLWNLFLNWATMFGHSVRGCTKPSKDLMHHGVGVPRKPSQRRNRGHRGEGLSEGGNLEYGQ